MFWVLVLLKAHGFCLQRRTKWNIILIVKLP
nr:MAG TPA: hypothetical protein [Bacteriophage sp.]